MGDKSTETEQSNKAEPEWRRSGRPKDGPVWMATVTDISPPGRKLLEEYSSVASQDVLQHSLDLRDRAWEIAPYGCVGLMGFAFPTIQLHPKYRDLLSRLQSSQATLLDLGCGLGQNIRQLVHDGAPPASLAGADLSAGLIECGYDYFLDRERLTTPFIVGDILDDADDADGFCAAHRGRYDIVWAATFFHLWDWATQQKAMTAATRLLKPVPGSMLIGWQIGASPAREVVPPIKGVGAVVPGAVYQHNEASMARMWEEIGQNTGTRWRADATNDVPVWLRSASAVMGGQRQRITFTIERLE